MFRENNQQIDFGEIRRRILFETSKIERNRKYQPAPGQPPQNEAPAMNDAPERRSPLKRLSVWLWYIRNIREMFEQAKAVGFAAQGFANGIRERVDQQMDAKAQQMDAKVQQMDEKIDALNNQLELTLLRWIDTRAQKIAELQREIMFQQRRLTRLALPGAASGDVAPLKATVDQRLDSFYLAFEEAFRGSREDIKKRLLIYLERVVAAGAGQPDKPILDVGCGRGEWIELLKENHLAAYGVDQSPLMAEWAVSHGLDVRDADLLEHLHKLPDSSLSGVTAFHIVEHLPFGGLIDFFDETLRVLVPGGVLILETPNPETIRVGATTFYNDPTHRNPIPPAVLQFMVNHRGFSDVETLKLHPFSQGLLESKSADAKLLNRVLFGPQDYAIIARRG
jgi:SAM-dependent methyltransferase